MFRSLQPARNYARELVHQYGLVLSDVKSDLDGWWVSKQSLGEAAFDVCIFVVAISCYACMYCICPCALVLLLGIASLGSIALVAIQLV